MYHSHEKGAKVNRTEPSTQTPSSRTRLAAALRGVSVALLVLGSAGVFLPTAVQAAQSHAFAGFFGSPGSGAGQLELSSESGVAVDQSSGDVYVADTGNHRVDEFDPSKPPSERFIRAWGWGVKPGDTSSTGFDACTNATDCHAGFPGAGAGQFENPTFMAVDNTPGGSGDIYVADLGTQANERQTVTLSAGAGGSYTLSFTAALHGTTTSGSDLLTAPQGRFEIGDAISGPGIPSGTTIVAYVSAETYEISAAATASGRAVLGATETTVPVQPNASAAELQVALANHHGLEGSVSVSGGAGGPYTVEFVNQLANTNVPQMTCDGSGLTPAGATCTVATPVEGKDTARVQKFDSSGNLLTSWGGTPAGGQLDGSTCAQCGGNPRFGRLEGVGVQPGGDLVVLGETSLLTEWTSSPADFVQSIGTFGDRAPIGMAFDPAGHLYMGKHSNSGEGSGVHFEVIQTSPKVVEGNLAYPENCVVDPGPAAGVAVDPSSEDVYVVRYNPVSNQSSVAAYGAACNPLESPFGGQPGEISHSAGIAASGFSGSKGYVYVADEGSNRVEIFAPGGPREDLTVVRTGTTLGSVTSEPAGIVCPSLCSASFPENEAVVLTAVPPEHATFVGWSGGGCSGTGACQVSLAAATTVTAVFAQDRPALTAGPVSDVTRHTATLTGTVDPEGDASSCRFEYGPTTAYGAEAPCLTEPGSGVSPVPIGAELWDLTADSTYHYRVVSANTGGVAYGPDETFATLGEDCGADAALCPAPPVVPLLATVAIAFPKQASPPPTTRALTDAQRLTKALKVCRKDKRKSTRVSCDKRAHEKYAPAKKARKSTRSKNRGKA